MDSFRQDLSAYLNTPESVTLEDDNTTLKDLMEQFTGICQPYYQGKPKIAYSNSIDKHLSTFSLDNQKNEFKHTEKTYSSTEQFESHQRKWVRERNKVEADLAVSAIFCAVNMSGGIEFGD